MKITNFFLYPVLPRWLFLKIETDEGICGWGEPVVEGVGVIAEHEAAAGDVKQLREHGGDADVFEAQIAEFDLAAQTNDFLSNLLDHFPQTVGADMRPGGIYNFLRRAERSGRQLLRWQLRHVISGQKKF